MPLTRDAITHSSRVMLVVYPIFTLLVGLSYAFGDPVRTSSPSLDVVRNIAPMRTWGWAFLALAALMLAAWVVHRREWMIAALRLGMATYVMWTIGVLAGLMNVHRWPPLNDDASFNAGWLWGFVAIAHYASLQSLKKDSPVRP